MDLHIHIAVDRTEIVTAQQASVNSMSNCTCAIMVIMGCYKGMWEGDEKLIYNK